MVREEDLKCTIANCVHNNDKMCTLTDDWEEIIQEHEKIMKEDDPDYIFEQWELNEMILNCDIKEEDEDRCEDCGEELYTEENYSMVEYWGARVRMPEYTLICPNCGEL